MFTQWGISFWHYVCLRQQYAQMKYYLNNAACVQVCVDPVYEKIRISPFWLIMQIKWTCDFHICIVKFGGYNSSSPPVFSFIQKKKLYFLDESQRSNYTTPWRHHWYIYSEKKPVSESRGHLLFFLIILNARRCEPTSNTGRICE